VLQLVTKLENPSASLGDGSSKSGAKPNDGVSNSDVECEGKEGKTQSFVQQSDLLLQNWTNYGKQMARNEQE